MLSVLKLHLEQHDVGQQKCCKAFGSIVIDGSAIPNGFASIEQKQKYIKCKIAVQ